MKQAILASTQSIWLEKILNGKKNREMRRTKPQCELPIDVYLYCAKAKSRSEQLVRCLDDVWRVIGCADGWVFDKDPNSFNGKVVGKFTLKTIESVGFDWQTFMETEGEIRKFNFTDEQLTKLCMSVDEANKYALQNTKKDVQLWHIDDLVIFDKPKELCDFHPYFPKLERWCHEDSDCDGCPFFVSELAVFTDEDCKGLKGLTKAPQSWQYVEVEE